jgi:hypothetical protein
MIVPVGEVIGESFPLYVYISLFSLIALTRMTDFFFRIKSVMTSSTGETVQFIRLLYISSACSSLSFLAIAAVLSGPRPYPLYGCEPFISHRYQNRPSCLFDLSPSPTPSSHPVSSPTNSTWTSASHWLNSRASCSKHLLSAP